jgi:hypothetical protein
VFGKHGCERACDIVTTSQKSVCREVSAPAKKTCGSLGAGDSGDGSHGIV